MTELGAFVDTFANTKPRLRRRMGAVVSIAADYSLTVTVAGDSTQISGVKYFGHYAPEVGSQVWLDTDGVDVIAIGALAGMGGSALAARVEKNANQQAETTATLVTFATAVSDPSGMFDDANDQLVVKAPGLYHISAGMVWSATTDTNSRTLQIRVSGNTRASVRQPNIGIASSSLIQNFSTIYPLVIGDTVTLYANQGTAAAIPGGLLSDNSTFLAMTYLGPAA